MTDLDYIRAGVVLLPHQQAMGERSKSMLSLVPVTTEIVS